MTYREISPGDMHAIFGRLKRSVFLFVTRISRYGSVFVIPSSFWLLVSSFRLTSPPLIPGLDGNYTYHPMNRTGKIARLPRHIREELNTRLEANAPGREIVG